MAKSNKTPKKSNEYYVYAIELKKTIWVKEAGFRKKNPHLTKEYNGKCSMLDKLAISRNADTSNMFPSEETRRVLCLFVAVLRKSLEKESLPQKINPVVLLKNTT